MAFRDCWKPSVRKMSGKERPLRVLVVEDEPLLGRLGVRVLESLGGMETALAQDGETGLELAWSWRPDVILLDLVLPVMSGPELLRRYRREGGRAKVLAVTGGDLEKARGLVFPLGADGLLGKPFRWGEVIDRLRMLADGLAGQCRTLLIQMGVRERSRGFRQAAECAALLGERECALLKETYVEVARRQKVKPASVAKNIERLAKEVHEKETPFYRRLTGRTRADPPLTNREFLDLLSQAARIPL